MVADFNKIKTMIEAKKALWLPASKQEKFIKKVEKERGKGQVSKVVEEIIDKYLNEKK